MYFTGGIRTDGTRRRGILQPHLGVKLIDGKFVAQDGQKAQTDTGPRPTPIEMMGSDPYGDVEELTERNSA